MLKFVAVISEREVEKSSVPFNSESGLKYADLSDSLGVIRKSDVGKRIYIRKGVIIVEAEHLFKGRMAKNLTEYVGNV